MKSVSRKRGQTKTPGSALGGEWLDSFFSASTAGLAILDSQLRYQRINRVLAETNGRTIRQHLGRSVSEVVPDLATQLTPLLRNVVATGQPVLDMVVSGETPQHPGRMRHWIASFFPLPAPAPGKPGIGVIAVEVTKLQEAEGKIRSQASQLRALAARLNSAQEDEARRIAREVHDTLGQQLTALKFELQHLEKKPAMGKRARSEHFQRMQSLLDGTIAAAQRISSELRLGHLEVVGLAEAICAYGREFSRRTGVLLNASQVEDVSDHDHDRDVIAFRILQEALTNVARHAKAGQVQLALSEKNKVLTLQVRDDGIGFNPEKVTPVRSIGLLGMRERAEAIKGQLIIDSAVGRGCLVETRLPHRVRR